MLSIRNRHSFVLVVLLAGCSAPNDDAEVADSPESVEQISQALTTSELLVAFRTSNNVSYLTAEGDGGGTISANRTAIGAWERFIVSDLNGGSLVSGDQVQIRHVNAAGASWWLSADNNGGGAGNVLRANKTFPQAAQTFVIVKRAAGPSLRATRSRCAGPTRST